LDPIGDFPWEVSGRNRNEIKNPGKKEIKKEVEDRKDSK